MSVVRRRKVGLNATCFDDRPSGAKQRFIGIYSELIKQNPDLDYVIFEPSDCAVAGWFVQAPNVTSRRSPIPSTGRAGRLWHGLRYWPNALAAERLDLLEGFHLPFVHDRECSSLLTIHDLRPLKQKPWSLERQLYKRVLRAALRQADHVVAVSDTVAGEIKDFSETAVVSRVYNGIDVGSFTAWSAASLQRLRHDLQLPEQLILAVGHLETRKNYPRLIEAFARLVERGLPHGLVIVGNDSGERESLIALVKRHGLAPRVQLLSNLSDAQVRGLYQLSALLVFPSLYEGFGIPILEAMASGRPVVTSDLPVFQEITQGQGRYFDPTSVDSMATAIWEVVQSEAERRRLVAYGRARVDSFAFSGLAQQMRGLYEDVWRKRPS